MFYPGGSAFNVSILAARYGLETAYIGTFGDDAAGRHQLKVLRKEGVDTSHISVREGRNAISKVINRNGQSKIVQVDKGVYKHFNLTEEDLKFIKKFRYVHTTIYSYTEKYLTKLKKSGMIISFDYSFKSTENYLKKTASLVDIAFFSAENINIDLKEFITFVHKLGPRYIVITRGKKGVLAFLKNELYSYPSRKVEIIDTLGAGDAFIAVFLSSFMRNLSPLSILEKSTESAVKCCERYGAVGWGRKDFNIKF